ncbi:hypothetical protein Dda_6636 [Drechslerella dactyloides]|uniref:Uncharacterized protein n=1 Tax=Drechslerella dactyloides TaxID=74499 RepID=A0AAD6ITX4_DREDA|nr:hypothetical protein Dda_6636 [Drechslerella dactyloides]
MSDVNGDVDMEQAREQAGGGVEFTNGILLRRLVSDVELVSHRQVPRHPENHTQRGCQLDVLAYSRAFVHGTEIA